MQTGIALYLRHLAARISQLAGQCGHRHTSAELTAIADELEQKAQRVEEAFAIDTSGPRRP
jgi:hypothetical protein